MAQYHDLISRSAAIERLRGLHEGKLDSAIVELCIMPPYKREPVKRGRWIKNEGPTGGWICSQCLINACRPHNYCPECGTKNKKVN